MKLTADLHTHTIASTHAYATITEMAQQAKKVGLFAMAVTDHARSMPGAPREFYFESLSIIPDYVNDVRILKGIEANICDYEGNIDVEPSLQRSLEIIVASLHTITIEGEATVEKCTQAYLKLASNPNVNIIGHSGSEYFKYDYDAVIKEMAKQGKLIELNDSAFRYNKSHKPNCIEIAKKCMQYGARICVDTDSHFTHTLGVADITLRALEDIGFPEKLIVNTDLDRMKAYLDECKIRY